MPVRSINFLLEKKLRDRFPSINTVDCEQIAIRVGKFYCPFHKWRRALVTDEEYLKAGWLSFFLTHEPYKLSQFSLSSNILGKNILSYRYSREQELLIHLIRFSYTSHNLNQILYDLIHDSNSSITGLASDNFFLFLTNESNQSYITQPYFINNIYEYVPFSFMKGDIPLLMYILCKSIYEISLSEKETVELACILFQAALVYPNLFIPPLSSKVTVKSYIHTFSQILNLSNKAKQVIKSLPFVLSCLMPSICLMHQNPGPQFRKRALVGVTKFLLAIIGDTPVATKSLIAGYEQMALGRIVEKEYYSRMSLRQLLARLSFPSELPHTMLSSIE